MRDLCRLIMQAESHLADGDPSAAFDAIRDALTEAENVEDEHRDLRGEIGRLKRNNLRMREALEQIRRATGMLEDLDEQWFKASMTDIRDFASEGLGED